MKRIRSAVLFLTLCIAGALTLLSVVGAFLGVDGARALFNSAPLVVVWISLTALLLVGFVYFAKLTRSPGGFMVHAGPVLILVGAMVGSVRGHAVVERLFGVANVPAGYMRIFEGEASNVIADENGQPISRLPFEIRLEDFWIEHYGEESPWRLGIDAPAADGGERRRGAEVEWTVGEAVRLPFVDATLEVLRYLPRARPRVVKGAVPTLEVVEQNGRRSTVPAKVGEGIDLADDGGRLEVAEVFGHLQIRGGRPVDVPGSNANPAVKVDLVTPGGERSHRYAFGRLDLVGHGDGRDGLKLRLRLPREDGAVADETSELPAMEVEVRRGEGDPLRAWLIARDARQPVALALDGDDPDGGAPGDDHGAFLVLLAREGAVRDYKSRLTVLGVGGVRLAEKVIEVNDPLHYGGYHFYQHSYDTMQGRFTVLGVRSDTGLDTVYLGFLLTCVGVVWLFWVRPIRDAIRRNGR